MRRSRVPASTLRFYEEKRLIASIGRRASTLLLDRGVLQRLELIAMGRAARSSMSSTSSKSLSSSERQSGNKQFNDFFLAFPHGKVGQPFLLDSTVAEASCGSRLLIILMLRRGRRAQKIDIQ